MKPLFVCLALLFSLGLKPIYAEAPPWKSLSTKQKCRELLTIAAVMGGFFGSVWIVHDAIPAYRQQQNRIRLLEDLQEPYQNLVTEYKALTQKDARYEVLVKIIFEEVQNSNSVGDLWSRVEERSAELEALGFSSIELANLPSSFQRALAELAMKAYSSGMSYEDLRWMMRKLQDS